jgi:hypothetical protein
MSRHNVERHCTLGVLGLPIIQVRITPSSPDQDEEPRHRMAQRCDYCSGPFGLRRYPQVRTRTDTRQFCCRRCATEYRIDLILRAYWRRICQTA